MRRVMAFGEPALKGLPVLSRDDGILFCHGSPLTPQGLAQLDAESTIVVTDSATYDYVIEQAFLVRPDIGLRWSYWRSLAWNPHAIILTRSLSRLYDEPPAQVSLPECVTLLSSQPSSGTVRDLQESSYQRIRSIGSWIAWVAGAHRTTVHAARLYQASLDIYAHARTVTHLDPLASQELVESGDVAQAVLSRRGFHEVTATFTHAHKLRSGPVMVRWSADECFPATLGDLHSDGGVLHSSLSVAKSRTLKAPPGILDRLAQNRTKVIISDRTFISTANFDDLGPWTHEGDLTMLPAKVRRR